VAGSHMSFNEKEIAITGMNLPVQRHA